MHILIVSQYFWPETFIINDLVKTLVAQGHSVKVLTGKPNYPEGKIFDGYTADGCVEETFGPNVSIFRVPLRPRKKSCAKNLLLNYFSFVFNGLRCFPKAVRGGAYDVVLVFALSPIIMAVPAIYLRWKLKSHLAIWVQDLWPESLTATGFIKNRFLIRAVGWLVRWIYGCADTLLVQSKGFIAPVSNYADPEKIVYYPNSYQDISSQMSKDEIPFDLVSVLESNFCLVFAGNLGKAQSIETIIATAGELKHLMDVKIVLVGSGSMLSWIENQKSLRGLDNLILAGRFSNELMPHIFKRSGGLLVTLKKEEIFSYTIPSKVQAYLAAGRPVIGALDGEGAKVIEEAGGGFTCPAEDVSGLVRCVEQLYEMPQIEREKLGQSGRAYFLEHFEMEKQAQCLVEILEGRIKEKDNVK